MKVECLLKLELCVDFYFQESLKIKDYSLEIDDKDFGRLFD